MTKSLLTQWRISPTAVRVVPFIVFVGLTAFQGALGEQSRYWVYVLKTIVGAGMLWAVYPFILEMRWKWSWDAAVVGFLVFLIWVGLDGLYASADALLRRMLCPVLKHVGFEQWCSTPASPPVPWNPHAEFVSPLAWALVSVRLAGSTLVVPPLEEVFYRSFLYRYIAAPDFQKVPLTCFRWMPFLVTAGIFGFAHYEWLPGVLCGMVYQGLVLRHNRLGDAMTAHAITNFLLGMWIIWKGAWHFW